MPPAVDKLDDKIYLNAGDDFDKVMAFVEDKTRAGDVSKGCD